MGGVRRLAALVVGACLLAPAGAAAAPVTGPREVVDERWTTRTPGASFGSDYTARYHAAGDPSGDPPYMRAMRTYNPSGMRFDTSVPPRCRATDIELALRGPDACPKESRIGGGTADGKFMEQPSKLDVEVFNNADEQIFVIRTPLVATITRGKILADHSIEFRSPTCYPAFTPPGCPVDTALQLGAHIVIEPYSRTIDGVTRNYMTTPPTCPKSGRWRTPIRFWWSDGGDDTVVTEQPCTRPTKNRRARPR